MTAEPSEGTAGDGLRSLEMRWIFPGKPTSETTNWFARFPSRTEAREDIYLLDPQLPELSVKVRGGGALDVKTYRGSPGTLEVADRACGRMEYWHKWSFPLDPPPATGGRRPGWQRVGKARRITRFSTSDGPILARPGGGDPPWCEVELTEISIADLHWWTIGFEASGPADLLRNALDAAAAQVFDQPLPEVVEPGLEQSGSYAEWLGQRPTSDS
jgi:hypothetical protein